MILGPPMTKKHMYDVEEAQEDFAFSMLIYGVFDVVLFILMIKRFKEFKVQLKSAKVDKKTVKKCKNKKAKKCKKRVVEESKEEVYNQSDIEAPVHSEPSQDEINPTIEDEDDSQESFIKKSAVAPEPQPIMTQSVQHMYPQAHPYAYPQTIHIDGKTYMAVKVSDLQNLQRVPAQSMYMRSVGYPQF